MKNDKEFDFLMENGWDRVPVSEHEMFYVKFNAAVERQGKRKDQLAFIEKIVSWIFRIGIALFVWLLVACNPQVRAYNKLYSSERKSTQKVQKRWVAGRHIIKPAWR